jgi:hypothetical protein
VGSSTWPTSRPSNSRVHSSHRFARPVGPAPESVMPPSGAGTPRGPVGAHAPATGGGGVVRRALIGRPPDL